MGTYILYLRKSRADDPRETVEEVLAKHETQLQEYAAKELGGRILEENIYREVVSGESIEDREEIQKVLLRIEDPAVAGVLVIEPQRLSRGDLEDCGRLISDLRYTNTKVVTPMMTYDLTKKMERKFFQDELLRGRDYLEYTKEILLRGRVAAIKRGCYIGTRPPYGFNKVKIGKDHTLEPNAEADVVRLVFDLYTREQLTPFQITQVLKEKGIPAPKGGKEWHKDTIRFMVRNHHYNGKVVFNKKKATTVLENGERKVKRLTQPDEEMIIAEGIHPAIISPETWAAAQELVARNPRLKHTYELRNPLSGVLRCTKCGRSMKIHTYKKAEDRYECYHRPRCFKSVAVPDLLNAVITALEIVELPALEVKAKNDDGDARKIQERLLAALEGRMKELRDQEEKQYDLLETGKYTQELFDRRNAALREKMNELQEQIFKAKASLPKSVDYEEKVLSLKAAIASLRNDTATPAEKNRLIKAIIERIDFKGMESEGTDRKGRQKGVNSFTLDVFLKL